MLDMARGGGMFQEKEREWETQELDPMEVTNR